MSFWDYAIFAGALFGGYIVSSFAIVIPLLVLKVSFPLINRTERLMPKGSCDTKGMRKSCILSLVIWLVIDAVLVFLVLRFVPAFYRYAILIGAALCFLVALGSASSPSNPKNRADFFQSNQRFVDPDELEKFQAMLSF